MQDADTDVTTGDGGRARASAEAGDVERVYREQGDRLWRALLVYSGDREEASDAVAEAFAQLLRRGRNVRDPAAWVWRAAFRIAAGEMKARQRRGRSGFSAHVETGDGPSDRLVAALRRLSPKQRGSVLLHHYAGHSIRETAAILGSTSAAVRVHLSQGRKRLRSLLEDDNED
jgi:RNA polymerase sigma-70 factor, ECF subfamily